MPRIKSSARHVSAAVTVRVTQGTETAFVLLFELFSQRVGDQTLRDQVRINV